jgi:hypothetical protein
MTTASTRRAPAPPPVARIPSPGRLLRIELRRNAMLWLLPVAAALFWYDAYRQLMAQPAMWNLRAMGLQSRALLDFAIPVAAAASWTGSRDGRRHTTDLVGITARPRWFGQLIAWAATTCWAMAGYLICVAVVYGITASQAGWGGPLWWPAVVGAFGIPVLTAIGFAAGTLFPGRFTTPLVALVMFFGLGFGSQEASGYHSYWQISPLIAGATSIGADPGVATFYHYLPDLSIAQVMFLCGLTMAVLGVLGVAAGGGGRRLRAAAAAISVAGLAAAGTAVGLAGTGRLDPHGMIMIPALHDAAGDQPIRYTPDCGHGAIPICLNPAYAAYQPLVSSTLEPELSEVAGLPGAPVRIDQAAEVYQQGGAIGTGTLTLAGHGGQVLDMVLPDGLPGFNDTTARFQRQLATTTGYTIMRRVVGPPGQAQLGQAQQAVMFSVLGPYVTAQEAGGPSIAIPSAGLPSAGGLSAGGLSAELSLPVPGSPAAVAGERFAALPAAERHAWLAQHLTALRAGRITLAQLP